jgi:hypothetical protein
VRALHLHQRKSSCNLNLQYSAKTCATTVSHGSDLSQLIRCVFVLVALFRKEQRGIRVAGVYLGLFGVAAFAKVLTIREGYGLP